jgi:hypothetical protein
MNTSHIEVQNLIWNPPNSKTDESPPEVANYSISSSENSPTFYDDNNDIIEFGPIIVKRRKKPAPTLSTGRRSRYEVLSPEEEYKRDVRRALNRAAADRVRINRLNVEQELQGQIDALEEQEKVLLNNVQVFQSQKLHLETRLTTHEKICPAINGTNSQYNLISAFNPPALQEGQPGSDVNIDELFLDAPTPLQNNDSDPLANMTPEDIEDFLMNP